ncbi:MAG: endonuclease/exonuclease/phosphatase family protein [Deltaproteobacteria bacterium]|nr:endonuclease/exonuclease/phosphatase family protein [Deltaproteobacteria bacterium]
MKRIRSLLWPQIILPALTVTFGMQIVRTLPPYLNYLLGDRLGWNATKIGLLGLLVFSAGFLIAWLNRRLGLRRLLFLSAGGLGLVRLGIQFWTGDPVGDMILTIVGMIFFIFFLPTYLVATQRQANREAAGYGFAVAILLGIAFDTAWHGFFLTYDFIWQAGLLPRAIVIGLVFSQLSALRTSPATLPAHSVSVGDTFTGTLPWIAIGPILLLQLFVFQNQARLTTLTNWSFPAVFTWVLISHLLGIGLAVLWKPRRAGAAAAGILLAVALWPLAATGVVFSALAFFIGQLSLAILLTTILRYQGKNVIRPHCITGTPDQSNAGLRNTAIVHGISMVLMIALLIGYYVTYSLPLPFGNDWLLTFAAVITGISAMGAVGKPSEYVHTARFRSIAALSFTLLLFPLLVFLSRSTPSPSLISAGPLRVMTYNVHNGFNTGGHLNMEALARQIEAEQTHIISLQEVSRGWVLNGSLDMLTWLSQRLNMPYRHFTPAGDALWGHAVLSRYPIVSAQDHPLPPQDLPLKRSFTYLQIDTGQDRPLNLINTHFQHHRKNSAIRLVQSEALINFLDDHNLNQFMIITGDLNATPDSPEIQQLYHHGIGDVVSEANLSPGNTFHADRPDRRIDYLLISSDLTGTDVTIPRGTISDHLGIAATILKH